MFSEIFLMFEVNGTNSMLKALLILQALVSLFFNIFCKVVVC